MTGAEAQSSSLNAEELLELLRSDGDQDECQAGVVTNKVMLLHMCKFASMSCFKTAPAAGWCQQTDPLLLAKAHPPTALALYVRALCQSLQNSMWCYQCWQCSTVILGPAAAMEGQACA